MFAQILAVAIFVTMFVLIIMDKIERHYITLMCGFATLFLVFGLGVGILGGSGAKALEAVKNTLNLHSIFTTDFWYAAGETAEESSGINWATIIFIAGMMVMVEGMARVGFFRWLCMKRSRMELKASAIHCLMSLNSS